MCAACASWYDDIIWRASGRVTADSASRAISELLEWRAALLLEWQAAPLLECQAGGDGGRSNSRPRPS